MTSCERRRGVHVVAWVSSALLATLVLAPSAFAAPSNDNQSNPFDVNLAGGAVTVSNVHATVEAGEPLTTLGPGSCDGTEMVATTWYRIVGNGGTIAIDTAGSDFDTVVAVYLAPIASVSDGLPCNDDTATQTSALSFKSVANQAYLVQVGGCNACLGSIGALGNMVMHVNASRSAPASTGAPAPPAGASAPPAGVPVPPGGSAAPPTRAPAPAAPTGVPAPAEVPAPPAGAPMPTLARLAVSTYLPYDKQRGGVRIRRAQVRAPIESRVKVRCTSHRCRSMTRTAIAPRGIVRLSYLRNRTLRRGTRIKIYVTRGNYVGVFVEYRVVGAGRSARLKRRAACLSPSAPATPRRC